MSRLWIVVGDITSSGGRVITGSLETSIDGKPVARINDQATCPLHKGTFPIIDGDFTTIIDGQPVALHSSKLACGCAVLAVKQSHVFIDNGGSGGGKGEIASHAMQTAAVVTHSKILKEYDEAFILKSELTGKPLARRDYRIVRKDGSVEEGTTDSEGRTHVVDTGIAELLEVELVEEVVT